MKEFRCKKCNCFLGKLENATGKLHKGIIYLCTECYESYKTFESLANYNKSSSSSGRPSNDMPDFFKGIFDGKVK